MENMAELATVQILSQVDTEAMGNVVAVICTDFVRAITATVDLTNDHNGHVGHVPTHLYSPTLQRP